MSTIFVTGGTGLTGANVCQQLIERGDDVRALVRNPDDAAALAAIGVELVQGDIADADDVLRAANGCEAAIHTAALLGGASQDLADFEAVNMVGTTNVLDAGLAHGMRRVVALSTGTFFDLSRPGPVEEAPVLDDPPDDPYTVTKLAAFREVHARAAAGEDVLTCHPGAIYGPSLVARRALHPTSFNAILLAALRGRDPDVPRLPRHLGGRRRCGVGLDRRPRPRRRRRAVLARRSPRGQDQHRRGLQPGVRVGRRRPPRRGPRPPLRPRGPDCRVRPDADGDRRGCRQRRPALRGRP